MAPAPRVNAADDDENRSQVALATATSLADDVLFPRALDVDRSKELPVAQLNLLVDQGLYGLGGPSELGGTGVNHQTLLDVIERIAGGCLTTCFIWVQHQGACRAVAEAVGPVHDVWAERLCRGEARSGVAFAHLLRAGPAVITAREVADGWELDGTAPWVTGWGFIDVVHVAARSGDDIVWVLADAAESSTLTTRRLSLAAIDASATNEVRFEGHHVPADRVTKIQPYDEWLANYPLGLRVNGSLSLGIARRTAELLGPTAFDGALAEARHLLDNASIEDLPDARGRISALAVKMTSNLVAQVGGRAVVADHHGQRLAREALFLLIQGQTPAIREAQLRYL